MCVWWLGNDIGGEVVYGGCGRLFVSVYGGWGKLLVSLCMVVWVGIW